MSYRGGTTRDLSRIRGRFLTLAGASAVAASCFGWTGWFEMTFIGVLSLAVDEAIS